MKMLMFQYVFLTRIMKGFLMARYALVLTVVVALTLTAGCMQRIEGAGQQAPAPVSPALGAQVNDTSASTEALLVEQVAQSRENYREGLQKLADFYRKNGNSMKLNWAQAEIKGLDSAPQYRFIIQAEAAGPDLRAVASIPGADVLYRDGQALYNEGRSIIGIADDAKLRMALDRFNRIIAEFPTSDKIGAAAYISGEIYEHFKDYSIAALYYKRAFQWDPNIQYPATFKAAYMYDKYLMNRSEALDLYNLYLARGAKNQAYKEHAEMRIAEINKQPLPKPQPQNPSVPPLP
jgi:tetratricopeptide (TPR) repeat protein